MATASTAVKIIIMGDAKNAQQAFDQARQAASVTAKAVTASFAAAAASFALIEGSVIQTSAEFERFKTQLDTIEGSSTKAAASMDWITQFTKNTPYELATVTDAFVQLKAFGIDPIANDSLKVLGNTSAAMGRTLDQSVQALADAATGEFERLKEFGIKARTVGNQVQFSYQQNGHEMVATADKTSQAMIQKTLLGIWNDKYAGGMDKLSKTWEGMTSNLSDNWNLFKKSIGDAGAFGAAKNSLSIVLNELQKNDAEVQALATNISDGLITAMEMGVTGTALMAKGFASLTTITDGVRVGIDAVSLSLVEGFDVALSGLQSFYDALAHLPGSVGQPYAQASSDIGAFRADLANLTEGIKQTGGESMAQLSNGIAALGDEFSAIDKKAIKFVSAIEKARNASSAPSAAQNTPSGSAPSGSSSPSKSEDPAVAKALADAQKIIDIHSQKFQRIQILGQASFADEQTMLLAKNDADIAALDTEQQRMMDAATLQGASKQQLDDLDAYYEQQKIDRAQQTADQIGAIDAGIAQRKAAAQTASYKFSLAVQKGEISGILGGAARMTAGLAQHNKAAFKANQMFAKGQVLVDGIVAVQKAASAFPFPFNVPGIAFETLSAAGRFAAVSSASFGGGGSIPSSQGGSAGGVPSMQTLSSAPSVPSSFNATAPQQPTTPSIQIVQHITAPNAQIGAADAIQTAANLGAQQALAAVGQDFASNGALRQQLAV